MSNNGTLIFNRADAVSVANIISGSGSLVQNGTGPLTLSGANTYTGTTVVAGPVVVTNPQGLGLGACTISGGSIFANPGSGGTVTLAGPLQVAGLGTLYTQPYKPVVFNLADGITGLGLLHLRPDTSGGGSNGTISVNGTTNFSGGIFTYGSNYQGVINFADMATTGTLSLHGMVTFSGAVQHAGTLAAIDWLTASGSSLQVNGTMICSGQVTLNTSATLGHLVMSSGVLTGNGSLSVGDGQLDLRGGDVNFGGGSSGLLAVNKTTSSAAILHQLPASFSGPINLQQGSLTVYGSQGTGNNPINVAASEAVLLPSGTISNPIRLNNSAGIAGGGGLQVPYDIHTNNYSSATLSGGLDLGASGAVLAVVPVSYSSSMGSVNVTGPLTGGALTIGSQLTVQLAGSQKTFAGPTDVRGGTLQFGSGGAMSSTLPITLSGGGMSFVYAPGSQPDRVPDATPVVLRAGGISIAGGSSPGQSISETIGVVTADGGSSGMQVDRPIADGYNTIVHLTLGGLVRNPGATVVFMQGYYGKLGGSQSDSPRLYITGQADTSFLGGGYNVNYLDFAKYSQATAVTALSTSDYNTSGQATWNANSNAVAGNETLTASRQLNSLKLASPGTLNLGSFTLNVISGGILEANSASISGATGSRLTAGGTAMGELIIHDPGIYRCKITVAAPITDNPGPDGLYDAVPGGPADADNGKVSLTCMGYAHFAGANTYTGATYIGNAASVFFDNQASVTPGPLVVYGHYNVNGNFQANIGPVTLRGGTLSHSNNEIDGGSGALNATAYNFEAGSITLPLVGSGPICKSTTAAAVSLLLNTSGYTGTIAVQDGPMEIYNNLPSGPPQSLPNPLSVRTGGNLRLTGCFATTGPLALDNATLQLNGYGSVLGPSSAAIGSNAIIQNSGYLTVSGPVDPFTDGLDPSRHASLCNNSTLIVARSVQISTITGGGQITVSSGAVLITDSIQHAAIYSGLTSNGSTAIRSGGLANDPARLSLLSEIGISSDGTVDVANQSLIVPKSDYSTSYVTVEGLIKKGYAGGTWTGRGGLVSSAAAAEAAQGTPQHTLACIQNGDLGPGGNGPLYNTFLGQNVSLGDILISFAAYGDADLSGTIDDRDFALMLSGCTSQKQGATIVSGNWLRGDFNYSGMVNAADYLLADHAFARQSGPLTSEFVLAQPFGSVNLPTLSAMGDIVPEPSSLAILVTAALLLARRPTRPSCLPSDS